MEGGGLDLGSFEPRFYSYVIFWNLVVIGGEENGEGLRVLGDEMVRSPSLLLLLFLCLARGNYGLLGRRFGEMWRMC